MIVGTAGHIDHGKTTLVKALTGVDTDRLPEEKQRGVSIELGYAFLDTPSGSRIGFIDVPGHERLVHTMLAGATGIDFALLLVAADDGVMPQTLEHLSVLALLGLRRAAVVITKCDHAEPQRVLAVVAEVAALLANTPFAGAPVLQVSAFTGQGIPELKALLLDQARQSQAHPRIEERFRLAVDRAFTLDGVGSVVTGTVHAGRVSIGDTLHLVPGDVHARVRTLHAQNRATQAAVAGERCALALAGIDRHQIERGQWLVADPDVVSASRLDVQLTLWHGETRALRSGTPVHLHLGAASVMASVAVLDPPVLEPGQSGRVQLVLGKPIGAWHGDRVVLRDAAASRTLAGGVVLDPFGPVRYRRTPQRLAELDALALPDPQARLMALLAVAPQGLDLRRYAAAQGGVIGTLPDAALRHTDARSDFALGADLTAHAQQHVTEVLGRYHHEHSDELGPDSARLRRLSMPRLPDTLWRALLGRMQGEGKAQLHGAFVHLPEHGVRLSAAETRLAQKVASQLLAAGFEGAWVRDLARDAAEPEALTRVTMARLAQRGELYQVVKDLYYPVVTMAQLAAICRQVASHNGGTVVAAGFRDATRLGRKRAIQILEHFDRIGLLRRVGDTHWLREDSLLFREAPL
jgi:selenocysteine-specific elongation factor